MGEAGDLFAQPAVTDGIAIYFCFGSSRQITIASGMSSVEFKNGRKHFGFFFSMKT